MSGPKISQAELERQRKQELERQRIERIRQIKIATDALIRTQDRIRNTIASIKDDMNFELTRCSDLMKKEIQETKAEAIAVLDSICTLDSVPPTAELIDATNQMMINDFNQVYGDTYLKRINSIKSALSAQIKNEQEDKELREKFHFSQLVKSVENSHDVYFCNARETFCGYDEFVKVLEVTQSFINNDSITVDDRGSIMDIRSDILAVMDTQVSTDIQQAVVNEGKLLISRVEHNIAMFNQLYDLYYSEYVAYMTLFNNNRRNKKLIKPREKASFDTLEQLENELLNIRYCSRRLDEQIYIRSTLDNVMREFGFKMSEELVFNSSTKGEHLFCRSANGNNGLHVHINENNAVMIEVAGYKTGQRKDLDEIDISLTDEEKHALFVEQNKFCDLHPLICERLSEQGVVFTSVDYKEPNLKYCKSIVLNNGENIDDLANASSWNIGSNKSLRLALNCEVD